MSFSRTASFALCGHPFENLSVPFLAATLMDSIYIYKFI